MNKEYAIHKRLIEEETNTGQKSLTAYPGAQVMLKEYNKENYLDKL